MSLVYRDINSNEYEMTTFDAPAFLEHTKPVWDVCLYSLPLIIETNVMIKSVPENPDY